MSTKNLDFIYNHNQNLNLDTRILDREKRACFDFFWNEANTDTTSPGFGLIRDNTDPKRSRMASIASNGFGFVALVVGVENGYISREEARQRVYGTLKTFYSQAEHHQGFFYHFLDMQTAQKYAANADVPSIIDTSLLLGGMLVASEYFGREAEDKNEKDNEIVELVQKIYRRVDWSAYVNPETQAFYMGLHDDGSGFGAWDMYAEQMIQYFLGVGSPTHAVNPSIYETFSRKQVHYKEFSFMAPPGNALFTHQFSHAFFNFSKYLDKDGLDLAENSRQATLASRQFAIDHQKDYQTFNEHSWGQTASDGPNGYRAYGAGYDGKIEHDQDGTIAPAAAAGSLVFTPEISLDAMNYMAQLPGLWRQYGLIDSYNFDVTPAFYSQKYIGIDKGITLAMIENYQSGLVWQLFMQNRWIQAATEKLGFKEK